MDLDLHSGGSVSVAESVFGADYNGPLVHQVVTAYMAGARSGTKAQKSRSDVRGGGRKPWAQKGTGRARAGTSSSPIWRSGGVTFAARPRDYSQKVNRKMYKGAIRSILSELVRDKRLVIVDEFSVSAPKTKEMIAKLTELGVSDAVIVSEKPNGDLYLAARNLHKVDIRDVNEIDPVGLIAFDKVVITVGALKHFEGLYA